MSSSSRVRVTEMDRRFVESAGLAGVKSVLSVYRSIHVSTFKLDHQLWAATGGTGSQIRAASVLGLTEDEELLHVGTGRLRWFRHLMWILLGAPLWRRPTGRRLRTGWTGYTSHLA